jgi:hypothetical protein
VPVIERLVGVYDADGTVRGELAYWVGARLGRVHCSLCDITHGRFRTRADWKAARATLRAPFDAYHRDDQPADVRAVAGGSVPVVVAATTSGMVVLLAPADLEACAGSVELFVRALDDAARTSGLTWPGLGTGSV